ncbi:hypothetical protein Q3G72_021774 [Acer saccharum]|nr:hypothetical protein Q3G72_021774 [Acer saccharum]
MSVFYTGIPAQVRPGKFAIPRTLRLTSYYEVRTTKPHCILRKNNNIGSMVAEIIQNLMYDYKLAGLVASYPFIKNNENYDGLEIRTLIKELNCTRKFYGLKYTYWDRRLLSKPSNILEKDLLHSFEENGHPCSQTYIQKHEEGFIEDATAATILQGYLDCGRMFYGNIQF